MDEIKENKVINKIFIALDILLLIIMISSLFVLPKIASFYSSNGINLSLKSSPLDFNFSYFQKLLLSIWGYFVAIFISVIALLFIIKGQKSKCSRDYIHAFIILITTLFTYFVTLYLPVF